MPENELKKVLERLEKIRTETDNKYWTINHETGEFLHNLVIDRNIKKILEIGTSIGYSGIWLASGLRETGGKLYTVESNKKRFDMAALNFAEAGVDDVVQQIFGHAPDVKIPDLVEMLFLDATKFEYKYYLSTYLFHMKKGGIIVADNALSHAEKLKDYKKMVTESEQFKTELNEIGTGLLISEIL
jgi:predicted O-methyltransferase YrrM